MTPENNSPAIFIEGHYHKSIIGLTVACFIELQANYLVSCYSAAIQTVACWGLAGCAKCLVKALMDYRSGKRESEVMSMMAKNLSDEDINLVASYFSSIDVTVNAL